MKTFMLLVTGMNDITPSLTWPYGEPLCTGICRNEGGGKGVSGGEDIKPVYQEGDRGDEEVVTVSDDDIYLV